MARSKPNSGLLDPTILSPKEKEEIPNIDELMRSPQLPPWLQPLPPPPRPDDPFGPVPVMPPRSPGWPFGPPYLGNVPPARNSVPSRVSSVEALPVPSVAAPAQESRGGLLGMMADAGLIDPSNPPAPPAGGLAGLIQEYLHTNRSI